MSGEWRVKKLKRVISYQVISNQKVKSCGKKKYSKVISLPYEARRAKWGNQVISDQRVKSGEGKGARSIIVHEKQTPPRTPRARKWGRSQIKFNEIMFLIKLDGGSYFFVRVPSPFIPLK